MTVRLDTVASGAAAVTPSDSTEVNFTSLYVGGAGDLALRTHDGNDVALKNVQAGTFVPLAVRQVRATGTTAVDIIGLK